jgi:hypothetical protein
VVNLARKRQNVFTRHPDGTEILEKLINKKMTMTKAAEKLGCTVANVSIYLRDHNLRPTLKQRQLREDLSPEELAMDQLAGLEKIILEVDGKTPMQLTAAVAWRTIVHGLLKLRDGDLSANEYVNVSQTLMRALQYQFKNPIPDIPEELMKLDPETEDRIIQRMEDFCEQCQYRRAYDERTAKEQNKFRMEPQESPPVG